MSKKWDVKMVAARLEEASWGGIAVLLAVLFRAIHGAAPSGWASPRPNRLSCRFVGMSNTEAQAVTDLLAAAAATASVFIGERGAH